MIEQMHDLGNELLLLNRLVCLYPPVHVYWDISRSERDIKVA